MAPQREYVYISDRKVQALAHLIPRRSVARVRALNVNLGAVGAGVDLAAADSPTRHQVLAGIEEGIRAVRTVCAVDNQALAPGDWIAAPTCVLSYGVPRDLMGGGAVVFVTRTASTSLVMVGAAHHLLDRQVAQVDVTSAMSVPEEIGRLLYAAAGGGDAQRWPRMVEYAYANLHGELTAFATGEPMTFLARVTHVFEAKDGSQGSRVVAATPLFVARTS